jgi:hypothetical protein
MADDAKIQAELQKIEEALRSLSALLTVEALAAA